MPIVSSNKIQLKRACVYKYNKLFTVLCLVLVIHQLHTLAYKRNHFQQAHNPDQSVLPVPTVSPRTGTAPRIWEKKKKEKKIIRPKNWQKANFQTKRLHKFGCIHHVQHHIRKI